MAIITFIEGIKVTLSRDVAGFGAQPSWLAIFIIQIARMGIQLQFTSMLRSSYSLETVSFFVRVCSTLEFL